MQSSPDATRIITAARTWVGTPYHHQAQLKGVGVDCVGLILGVGKEAGFMGPDVDDRFAEFDGYSRVPNPRKMLKGMELFLDRAPFAWKPNTPPPPGSIGWFQWRDDLPMHLAVIGETEDGRVTMIHAYSLADRAVEHTLDDTWAQRINSVWVFRGSIV
jgi:cell wall-associated NlpC family hydrolase